MRTKGNVSKVAICERCNGFLLGCHVDYLSKITEMEFTDLTNDGFTIKLETITETLERTLCDHDECSKGLCSKN